MIEKESLEKRQKILYVVTSILVTLAVSLCLYFSVQVITNGYVTIGGHSMFRVVTGSMEPTIQNGALLLCKKTPIENIQKDDIVCYKAKNEEIRGAIITHRVTAVVAGDDGGTYLETRGDANLSTDPYYVEAANLVGKVTWHSGKDTMFTDILALLSGKIGFFSLIVFPILVAAGLMLQSAVNNMQKDIYALRRELAKESHRGEDEDEELYPEDPDLTDPDGIAPGDRLLPGYTTLTYSDYEEIYEMLKREFLEELNEKAKKAKKG